jgi:hypothetical protein
MEYGLEEKEKRRMKWLRFKRRKERIREKGEEREKWIMKRRTRQIEE